MRLQSSAALILALALIPLFGLAPVRADVQLLDLEDFSASPSPASLRDDVLLHGEVCLRMTDGQDQYRVRLAGESGLGFALAADQGPDRLPFRVTWDSRSGGTQERNAPGEVGVFQVSNQGCASDAWLAGIELRVPREALEAAQAGHYRGGLVVEISVP